MIVQWNLMGTAGHWEPAGGPKPTWVLGAPKEELSVLGLRASRGQSCLGMGEEKRKRERRERGKGRRRGKRRVRLQELSVPRPREGLLRPWWDTVGSDLWVGCGLAGAATGHGSSGR